MTLTITGVQTAPDAYDFTVSGVDPAAAPTYTVDYGDGTGPFTHPTDPTGTTVTHHVYAVAGHHTYTVTATAARKPLATTLVELANLGQPSPPAQSMFAALTPVAADPTDLHVGAVFTPQRDGMITAIKFCKRGQTSTSRPVSLWDATGNVKLAEVTTSNEPTADGWYTATLPTPYQVKAGTSYVAAWRTVDKLPYISGPVSAAPDLRYVTNMVTAWPNPPNVADSQPYVYGVDVVFVPFVQGADQSMFPAVVAGGSDPADVWYGSQFTPRDDGLVRAIRFYKLGATSTSRTVAMWDAAGTTKLYEATTSNEPTADGWYTATLPVPFPVKAGTTYVAAWRTIDKASWGAKVPATAPDLTYVQGMGSLSTFPDPPSNPAPNALLMADVVFATTPTLADLAALPGYDTLGSWPASTGSASTTATVDVGPATIWATVVPGNPIPVVQVDAYVSTGQNVIRWEIAREPPGSSVPLYVGTSWDQAASFIDATAPLGTPVTYRLTVTYADYSASVVLSNTVTITGTTGCYLTNPSSGVTVPVTLATWPERTRTARRSVIGVLARPDPVALSDVHLWPSGAWSLYTATDAATDALIALLTASTYAVLRTQPSSSIEPVTVSVGDVVERRYSGKGDDQRRFVDVEIQEIQALPATALPLDATLFGLATVDGATLGELSQFRETLRQLSMVPTGVVTRADNV